MFRIAQLTLNSYVNYGTTLQKYALQQVLNQFADFTESLWFQDMQFYPESGVVGYLQKSFPDDCDEISEKKYTYRAMIFANKFREFENRYIKNRFELPYIEDIADEYDFFVVGSDQVWNPAFCIKSSYNFLFLNFAPREKRIAYAADIGFSRIYDTIKEKMRNGISGFDNISVRDENSFKIVKELTGKDSTIVMDPTLLLNAEDWLKIALKPSWIDEKYSRGYILTYYLRYYAPDFINDWAKKLNLPVINLLDFHNHWHYTVGPDEFIWLIANASLIFTNSFHGVALSINFKKPFFVYDFPLDEWGIYGFKIYQRIPYLLKKFELQNRIMKKTKNYNVNSLFDIEYPNYDEILVQWRKQSLDFLSSALGVLPRSTNGGGGKL